jgi:hypothetical protein
MKNKTGIGIMSPYLSVMCSSGVSAKVPVPSDEQTDDQTYERVLGRRIARRAPGPVPEAKVNPKQLKLLQ